MIEFLSKHMTLNEGDLIFTGTPAGVGQVAVGDKIHAELNSKQGKRLCTLDFNVEAKI